jgi:hypothetical protein
MYVEETRKCLPFNKHITPGGIMQQQKRTKEFINEGVTQKGFCGSRMAIMKDTGAEFMSLPDT